jgi:hypothetical protein
VEDVTELLEAATSIEKEARVAGLSSKAVAQDVPQPMVAQGAYGGLVEVGRD